MFAGQFYPKARDELKLMVRAGTVRLMLGTDAASEGLNLQRLARLINLDLPWNPTKLEQRKGGIQRTGQIPDVLEDVWVAMALGEKERVKKIIDEIPKQHPFEIRYTHVGKINWETCREVLDARETVHGPD